MTFDLKKDKDEVILNGVFMAKLTPIEPCHLLVSALVGKQTVTNYSVICDVVKLYGSLSTKTCIPFPGDACLSWNREMLFLSTPYCFHCFTVSPTLSHVRPIMFPWKSASFWGHVPGSREGSSGLTFRHKGYMRQGWVFGSGGRGGDCI